MSQSAWVIENESTNNFSFAKRHPSGRRFDSSNGFDTRWQQTSRHEIFHFAWSEPLTHPILYQVKIKSELKNFCPKIMFEKFLKFYDRHSDYFYLNGRPFLWFVWPSTFTQKCFWPFRPSKIEFHDRPLSLTIPDKLRSSNDLPFLPITVFFPQSTST